MKLTPTERFTDLDLVKFAYNDLVFRREPIFAFSPVASKNYLCLNVFESDSKLTILLKRSKSVTLSLEFLKMFRAVRMT